MRTIFIGECNPERTFLLVDPDSPVESEFEYQVVRALSCAYPSYRCVTFGGTFALDGLKRRPDLALIAKDFSHWFVIEVELSSHSLDHHVLPQVRAFKFGVPQADCVKILSERLEIDAKQAQSLLYVVPRTVAVVANKYDIAWVSALKGLGTQFLSLSIFKSSTGLMGLELEGRLQAFEEYLGYGTYQATDRSLRFPKRVPLPAGLIELLDFTGTPSTWKVVRDEDSVWATKEHGIPDIDEGSLVQLIRTNEGHLFLRPLS